MFLKRATRTSRRQRVLEELLWLDPVDRERRIIAAVAAGDFGADEAEASLRLVTRLDSLREMALPPGGRLLGSQPGVGYVPNEETEGDSGNDPGSDLVAVPIVPDPASVPVSPELVGIPVGPEEEAVQAGTLPIDALESAERWIAHEKATRQPRSRTRSDRRAVGPRSEWNATQVGPQGQMAPTAEEVPSISWLRPA